MNFPPICPHCQHTMVVSSRAMPDGEVLGFWRCNCAELPEPVPGDVPVPVSVKTKRTVSVVQASTPGMSVMCPACGNPMVLESSSDQLSNWTCACLSELSAEEFGDTVAQIVSGKKALVFGPSEAKAKAKTKTKRKCKSPAGGNRALLQIDGEVGNLRHLLRLLNTYAVVLKDTWAGDAEIQADICAGTSFESVKARYDQWLGFSTSQTNLRLSEVELGKLIGNLRVALRIPDTEKIPPDYALAYLRDPVGRFVRDVIDYHCKLEQTDANVSTAELGKSLANALGIIPVVTDCFVHSIWHVPGSVALHRLDELPQALSSNDHWRKSIGA